MRHSLNENLGNKGTTKSENRNTLGNVMEIDLLNKIKMVITYATWGECDKCVDE
jgi:hypothetical protein